jgi:hypothetical protein
MSSPAFSTIPVGPTNSVARLLTDLFAKLGKIDAFKTGMRAEALRFFLLLFYGYQSI